MRRGLAYDLPLEDGFTAQLVLPYDLRESEARKIAAFVSSLVCTWESENRPRSGGGVMETRTQQEQDNARLRERIDQNRHWAGINAGLLLGGVQELREEADFYERILNRLEAQEVA